MGIIVSIVALLLSSSAAYAQTPQVERIRFTEYGIYTVDRDVQGRDVLGINRAAATNVRHAATLRTIPAQIGTYDRLIAVDDRLVRCLWILLTPNHRPVTLLDRRRLIARTHGIV